MAQNFDKKYTNYTILYLRLTLVAFCWLSSHLFVIFEFFFSLFLHPERPWKCVGEVISKRLCFVLLDEQGVFWLATNWHVTNHHHYVLTYTNLFPQQFWNPSLSTLVDNRLVDLSRRRHCKRTGQRLVPYYVCVDARNKIQNKTM